MPQIFRTTNFFTRYRITLAILIGAICPTVVAQSSDSPFRVQLLDAVTVFLNESAIDLANDSQGNLNHRITGLDPRLQLPLCQESITIKPTQPNWLRKRAHLRATCNLPHWSLLVGVELALYRNVLVACTAVQKNQSLMGLTEFAELDVLGLHSGFLDSEESVKAKVAKRHLTPGQVITPPLIKAQVLVPRNGLVQVKAQIGTISVTSEGIALENGAFGDTIKVRNTRSKKVIEARVVRANMVEVIL